MNNKYIENIDLIINEAEKYILSSYKNFIGFYLDQYCKINYYTKVSFFAMKKETTDFLHQFILLDLMQDIYNTIEPISLGTILKYEEDVHMRLRYYVEHDLKQILINFYFQIEKN